MKKIPTRKYVQLLLWLSGALLLWFTFQSIPFAEVGETLKRLNFTQMIILVLVNLLVVFSLSGRWWWILRSMGYDVPYTSLSAYRLAGFAVSYFTPGPQFGGEPLQVYLLSRRHGISGSSATAAVTLDKAIELLGNFTFLVFGLLITIRVQFFSDNTGVLLLYAALGILLVPILLLIVVWRGHTPLAAVLRRLPERLRKRSPGFTDLLALLERTEEQISAFCCDRPQGLIGALGFNLATWGILITEYWLMSSYLDLRLTTFEIISVLTLVRLAFLTPLPGGVGVLEAGQALAFSTLGYTAGEGLSLGLLIRVRDLVFGGLGLLLAYLFGRQLSQDSSAIPPGT